MCTVIVGYKLFDRQPIVIAANRDELLDRPTEPPAPSDDEVRILSPKDLQRGGTPIGVSGAGVFAAITNRFDVESVGGQASRGYLPLMALMESTAHDAMLRITALDARGYNGFNLVVGDEATGLFVIRGDGAGGRPHPYVHDVIPPSDQGLMIVSNLGIGPAHAPRAEKVARVWEAERLQRERPHRAVWDALLTIHDPHPNEDAAWMKRMASTCIHRPSEDNYGTKASAFIVLDGAWGRYGAEWRWWHRERPDPGTHNCQGRWQPELKLPIAQSER